MRLQLCLIIAILIFSIGADIITFGADNTESNEFRDESNGANSDLLVKHYPSSIEEKINMTNPIQLNYNIFSKGKESSGIDPAIATIIVGLVGALAVLSGAFLNNYLEKGKREEERKFEREKWKRDQLQKIYSNCIENLSIPSTDYKSALKWLNILLIYHPDRTGESFSELKQKIDELKSAKQKIDTAENLLEYIIEQAANDKRLQT
jgi:hypothetical protein